MQRIESRAQQQASRRPFRTPGFGLIFLVSSMEFGRGSHRLLDMSVPAAQGPSPKYLAPEELESRPSKPSMQVRWDGEVDYLHDKLLG